MSGRPICSRCGCEVTKPFTATVFDEDGEEAVVKDTIIGDWGKRCVVIYTHSHCRWNAARRAEANIRAREVHELRRAGPIVPSRDKDYFFHGYKVRKKGERIMLVIPFRPVGGKN